MMYTIKDVSKILQINSNAIRFYEKKHLITPNRKANDYREFTTEDIGKLQMILLFRKMGFSIEDISELLNKKSQHSMLELFSAQYTALNEHLHAMSRIRETMTDCIENMLNESALNEALIEQMETTSKNIALANQWKDLWAFDEWAGKYDEDIRRKRGGLDFYAHYDQVIDQTSEKIKKGTVVEIGIGTGNLAKKTLDTHSGVVKYIGVDQSINMLKQAKKKCPDAEVRLGTFLNIPLKDHLADTIVTSYAFHHCNQEERQLSLLEMDRVLKTNGRIIITDLMFANDASRLAFENQSSSRVRAELEDEFFTTVEEVTTSLSSLGYSCTATPIDELIWMIVAER